MSSKSLAPVDGKADQDVGVENGNLPYSMPQIILQ